MGSKPLSETMVYRGVLKREEEDSKRTLRSLDLDISGEYKNNREKLSLTEDDKCPHGLHSCNDGPCICIHYLRLDEYLSEEVLTSWHLDREIVPKDLTISRPLTVMQGGQGVVFYMQDQTDPSYRVALKFKFRPQISNEYTWNKETREMDLLKEISHHFIVRMLHCFETNRGLLMVLEYLSRGSLWNLVKDNGVLPVEMATYYSACIIDALSYLHNKSIVYRDLKSENVVLNHEGSPRLIDFGLSKKVDDDGESQLATKYDYVAYLAPEFYTSPNYIDAKVDSWGIGFLLTELIVGYGIFIPVPWQEGDISFHLLPNWTFSFPKDHGKNLSDEGIDFITTMLDRNPAYRLSMEEAKSDPFYKSIPWKILPEVRPPENPYDGEIAFPQITEEVVLENGDVRIPHQYVPIQKAPTIRLEKTSLLPHLSIDLQLAYRMRKAKNMNMETFRKSIIAGSMNKT